MEITELHLNEGEHIFIIAKDENGKSIHAATVFVLDGKIQLSN